MEVVALLERQRHRATALEVSLHTGWTVEDSEEALNRLMVDVRGTFEISGEDGRVLYSFPRDARARLRATRRRSVAAELCSRHGGRALRVLVGGFVVASLAVVAAVALAAALALMVAASRAGGHRNQRGPGLRSGLQSVHEMVRTWNLFTSIYWCCGGENPFFRPVPMYGFGPWGYYGMYPGFGYGFGGLRYARRRGAFYDGRPRRRTRAVMRDGVAVAVPVDEAAAGGGALPPLAAVVDEDAEALLEGGEEEVASREDDLLSSLHAFFFGPELESETATQWRSVAAAVAAKGGVVAPEELAPHLPKPPRDLSDCARAACAASAHFGGRPCSSDGAIVLEFVDLTDAFPDADVGEALVEAERPFAGTRAGLCAALVVGDVVGLYWLKTSLPFLNAALPFRFPEGLASFLLVYAVVVASVPLIRFPFVVLANRGVAHRNEKRQELARLVGGDDPALASKVRAARRRAAELGRGRG